MPARLFLSSGDLMADRRFDFARDLQLKGDLVAAADLFQQATDLAPGFASAWFTLGEIREQLAEREAAIAAFRKAQAADPEDPQARLLQARHRSRLRHRAGGRCVRQGGRSFHRHRSVAAHDREGACNRVLCRARGRRHAGGVA
jgi:tetratricopeptide (TPR) repeat protein